MDDFKSCYLFISFNQVSLLCEVDTGVETEKSDQTRSCEKNTCNFECVAKSVCFPDILSIIVYAEYIE